MNLLLRGLVHELQPLDLAELTVEQNRVLCWDFFASLVTNNPKITFYD